ncbi:MAG: sulfoxide reductase heme-binding subunit YedZ [Paracoccaceae bacterium]|jgi:sulfoxide reductase heme-binding subunit YedZ
MIVDRLNTALRRIPTWTIYGLGVAHIGWLFWLGISGGLGVEPISALEHVLGETGLKLLLVGLAITPLRRFAGINLIRFRRAVGLTAFVYITVHLLVWLFLDVQMLDEIWKGIVKRPYITIGMLGFVLMIPLAVTSNNLSLRKLGPGWRRLHRLTYIVVLLGALHFVMLAKGFQIEPLIYMAVALALLATRIKWPARSGRGLSRVSRS